MNQPSKPPVDNRGNQIFEGDTVVYNFSGQMGMGTVSRISVSNRYGRPGWTIHIQRSWPQRPGPAVSKVQDPLNVMVIYE